jgi:hypothetical protein
LDTLEQKITDSRTNYEYRWNRSLATKNHGTKISSRGTKISSRGTKISSQGTKIWILWNKILLIAEQITSIGGTQVYLPKIMEQKLVLGEQKFGYDGTNH